MSGIGSVGGISEIPVTTGVEASGPAERVPPPEFPFAPRILELPLVGLPPAQPALLPEWVALGAYAAHSYEDPRPSSPARRLIQTVFGPIPSPAVGGRVYDLNDKPWEHHFPERFLVGDGGHTRAIIGVDQRPGTPLDLHLGRIVAQIPRRNGVIDPEDAIQFVTHHTLDYVGWAEGGAFGDGRPTLPWDRQVQLPPTIFNAFDRAAQDAPGLGWRDAEAECPVVPLERWLNLRLGYCIQQSLVAALVLDRVGVSVRVVNGAIDQGPGRSSGHTWVETLDGRVIDPGWRLIVPKFKNSDPLFPERYWVGDSYRFESTNYPYLILS
ncbi:MAG: lasso peptide biosynthesis protein [Deltaproteobacteria bacterium]|nr:lasso peptide biosynthesis protein [Deltaproteobacteria bacterium]